MSDAAPLPILPVVSGNDAGLTGSTKTATAGIKGQGTGSENQAEGSFLDFLNAFNTLAGVSESADVATLEGGSALPLISETAEVGRMPLQASTSPGRFTMPSEHAELATGGAQPGAITASFQATDGNGQYMQGLASLPLTGGNDPGMPDNPDLSSRLSGVALATGLAGPAQTELPVAGLSQGELPPDDLVQAGLVQDALIPVAAVQSPVTPVSPLPVSGSLQPSALAGSGDKGTSAKSAAASISQPGSILSEHSSTDTVLANQTIDSEVTETDALFATQMKKIVVDQQAMTNLERQLNLNTQASVAAGSTNDPVSASQIRAGMMPSTPVLDTAMPTAHQATITETFGRPEWNQAVGKQMTWMANQNIRSAELRLNPAHLGPIEVRIEMEDDQVSLAFSSRHAVVREAMEQAIPRLREMFEESGLNLTDTDVSQHSFAEQRSQQAADYSEHHTGGFASQSDSAGAEGAIVTEQTRTENLGLVDYYV